MTDVCRPPLSQIALSVIDLQETGTWFEEGLGFLPAGGTRFMTSMPSAGKLQGMPMAASTCWWLVGRNPWFQLELFQFTRPMGKLMPADFRPCDIGYTRIGVHVTDFEEALGNLARLGSRPLAPVPNDPGRRRACVRNPDGVYVEILEEDPLPQDAAGERFCKAAVRSVTLSTPDLAASIAYFSAITGRAPSERALHRDEHEALWGLAGAKCRRAVFECGDVLVELVEYSDPIGKPWPKDYRICDQGILNVAVGVRDKSDFAQVHKRALAFGARPNSAPVSVSDALIVYVNDALGFSVEIISVTPGNNRGFEPAPKDARSPAGDETAGFSVTIDKPLTQVWRLLNDHSNMKRWMGYDEVSLSRPGTPDRTGYGAERLIKGKLGTFIEQIVGVVPERRILYRILQGSPLCYYNGEILLTEKGDRTEVSWTVRFRSKWPFVGSIYGHRMRRYFAVLKDDFKRYAEQSVS